MILLKLLVELLLLPLTIFELGVNGCCIAFVTILLLGSLTAALVGFIRFLILSL